MTARTSFKGVPIIFDDEIVKAHVCYHADEEKPEIDEIRKRLLLVIAEALIETRQDIQPVRRTPVLKADELTCYEIRLVVQVS